MPIKPENRARYPKDWKTISKTIRARSLGQCECLGECGLHSTNPGPRRCVEVHGSPAIFAKGMVILTVAHLDHTPENCDHHNLKAMCQRCHLRYDSKHHQKNARETRNRKRGQTDIFTPTLNPEGPQ